MDALDEAGQAEEGREVDCSADNSKSGEVALILCRGCGERKIPTAFHRDVRSKNGRARRCKTCVKDYQIGWSTRNKRSYTPPSGTKLCPRCGEEKPVDEFHRATAAADGLGSWCKVCKSDVHQEYRIEQDEVLRKKKRSSYQKDPEKYRSSALRRRRKLRMEALIHYGGNPPKCACCGEAHLQFLCLDHIHGGGTKHKKAIGKDLYSWAKTRGYPLIFRVLCHNCNMALGMYGHCPHQDE